MTIAVPDMKSVKMDETGMAYEGFRYGQPEKTTVIKDAQKWEIFCLSDLRLMKRLCNRRFHICGMTNAFRGRS